MGMYFECELKKIDIDEVLSNVRYIEPEDLVVLYREKIRRLESALKNSEDDNIRRSEMNKELSDKVECLRNNNRELLKENGRLKEGLQLVCENYNAFNEDAKHLLKENKDLKESVKKLKEEREILSTKQVYFEDQINTLNATCEGYTDNINAYRKEVDQLTQENKKLIEERDALWDETQHLDKIYKQLLNEKKRLQENFEELKASSDLSMSAELAEMFEKFIDKNEKIRDDLGVKINEFREKYQLK